MLNAETNGTRGTGAEDNGSAASQSTPLPSSTSGSGGEEGSKGGGEGGERRGGYYGCRFNIPSNSILDS